jgi:hypothetical protein
LGCANDDIGDLTRGWDNLTQTPPASVVKDKPKAAPARKKKR